MTAWLSLCMWAAVTSTILLTTDALHSTHTSSGYSKFEGPAQGRHRPIHRGPQVDEGEGANFVYDLVGQGGPETGLQKEDRFETGGDDLDVKSWPVRGSETGPRQHFVASDHGSDSDRFKDSQSSLYEDEDEDELDDNDLLPTLEEEDPQKNKRESHSLSIVNPLDVLRQRLMLDLATRKMKQNQEQIKANDVILKHLGKRSLKGRRVGGLEHRGRTGKTTKQRYLSRQQDSATGDFNV